MLRLSNAGRLEIMLAVFKDRSLKNRGDHKEKMGSFLPQFNETSPLGWWTLKPRPKEERELAHLYERLEFPYPGDKEAMDDFIAKGGMIGTIIGPKRFIENDKDSVYYQKQLQDKKFEQAAQKLWFRMRNEVIQELQEKGYDVE